MSRSFGFGLGVDRQYKVRNDETTKDNSKPPLKNWQLQVLHDAMYPLPQLPLSGGGANDHETLKTRLGDLKRDLGGDDAHDDTSDSGNEKKKTRR